MLINSIFLQDDQFFHPALEAHLLDYGLIVEPSPSTIVLQPGYFAERWPGELGVAVANLVAEAGAAKSKGEPFSTSIVIATTDHPELENELRIVGETTILSEAKEPEYTPFSSTFPLVSEPEELIVTDTLTLWKRGEKGVRSAFERQFRQNWATTAPALFPFILGPQFE